MLVLYSRDDFPELNNYEILEGNSKCEECTRQLWNDMTKKSVIERTTPFSPAIEKKLTMNLEIEYFEFANTL